MLHITVNFIFFKEEVATRCERLLHEFSGLVHPNHKLMIDVQSRLAEAYGSGEEGVGPSMDDMTRPMLQRKAQACQQVRYVVHRKETFTKCYAL